MNGMFDFVVVNTTGTPTGEQMRVLRNVAAQHLRQRPKDPATHFRHEFCAGVVINKGEGSYGTFGGTFFRADVDTVQGTHLSVDFLIPRTTEWLMLDEEVTIWCGRPLPYNDYGIMAVDTSNTEKVETWTE